MQPSNTSGTIIGRMSPQPPLSPKAPLPSGPATTTAGLPSRVLLTGAGGFIATAVGRLLVEAGVDVTGVDVRSEEARQRANLSAGAWSKIINADVLDVDLRSLLRSVDAIVHLAGSPGVQSSWAGGFEHHVRNNVVTTQRLLEAALDAPVGRIVVASSSSVYGHVGQGSADERSPLAPLSPYGASKAAMEHVVGAYVERGLSVTPLRYFTVYGPHQRPDMAMHRMIEATRGGPVFRVRGDGEQLRNFTFVDDAARATVAALQSDLAPGLPVNVGGSGTASVNEVLALIEELAGAEVKRETSVEVPGDPGRTAANIDRARQILRWSPQVSLRDGLAAQIAWQAARARQNAHA